MIILFVLVQHGVCFNTLSNDTTTNLLDGFFTLGLVIFLLHTRRQPLVHCLLHTALFRLLMETAGPLLCWVATLVPVGMGQWLLAFTPVLITFLPLLLSYLLLHFFYPSFVDISWVRWGKITRTTALWGGITALSSVLALVGWSQWTDGLSDTNMVAMMHGHSPLLLVGNLIVFAFSNALFEEFVFRGLFQSAFANVFPLHSHLPILFSSLLFGAVHFENGFPNGMVGYAMTFVYAFMLGKLRQATDGLLLPYLVHVVADLAIGGVLFYLTVHG